ncbi:hypothetical protein Bpfe_013176, partial [Biomphalaria pfeifferi]
MWASVGLSFPSASHDTSLLSNYGFYQFRPHVSVSNVFPALSARINGCRGKK